MPNRIIREGWLESERINLLSAEAERFYLRLCLRADDFGRYYANPVLLKSALFPLREDARSTDMTRNLAACEKAGLVRCYSDNDGKVYVEIINFKQRTRSEKSKFPSPPTTDGQLTVNRQPEDSHPRTYSYSYSETDAYSETDSILSDSASQVSANNETRTTEAAPVECNPPNKSAIQLRAEAIFHKRPQTPMDRSEQTAWKHAKKIVEATTEDEWLLLERYYGAVDTKTAPLYRRRNLATLLNNWAGEISCAREWASKQSEFVNAF